MLLGITHAHLHTCNFSHREIDGHTHSHTSNMARLVVVKVRISRSFTSCFYLPLSIGITASQTRNITATQHDKHGRQGQHIFYG